MARPSKKETIMEKNALLLSALLNAVLFIL